MKKLLLIAALIVPSFALLAQKITVAESTESVGGGNNNVLEVSIYESTPETISKEVKLLLKDYNAKVSSQDGGWVGKNADIKKMKNDTVDIYARWDKVSDDETRLMMGFNLGGTFISSSNHPAEFKAANDIVTDFAVRLTTVGIAALIKTEQKTFDKLADDQKKLKKENQSLKDDIFNYKQKIEDYQQRIKKAQDDIETNNENQGKKKQELDDQQKVLDAANGKQSIVK